MTSLVCNYLELPARQKTYSLSMERDLSNNIFGLYGRLAAIFQELRELLWPLIVTIKAARKQTLLVSPDIIIQFWSPCDKSLISMRPFTAFLH